MAKKRTYIAKEGGWFKPGTEVVLEDDCGEMGGIFSGIRVCENSLAEGGLPVGLEYQDEELCPWDEFDD